MAAFPYIKRGSVVNQIIEDDLCGSVLDIANTFAPRHLVVCFECFGHTFIPIIPAD